MVLWYRDRDNKPIYSFDVRGRAFREALHWSDPMMFGPRAFFLTEAKPAALTLDGVTLDDEGLYRCRVDFRTTPTRNFAINLTVIVPPHQILIYDNSGRDVAGEIGPLEEGSDLVLTCEVRGGRPPPAVNWFVNDQIRKGHFEAIGNNVMINRLEMRQVKREDLNSTFRCQASNTKLVMPAEKTVQLDMLLRPLSTSIINKPAILLSDQTYNFTCEVKGSRPPAIISWVKENRKFRRGKFSDDKNETVVSSTVTFAPVPEDDGTFLKCLGDNPSLPGVTMEDSFKLNVIYPPQVSLNLGSTLNPEDIKEGDDVYFECSIRANPKEHKITWFHDENVVVQNMSSGVIISAHSLVLQRVTRWQGGAYTCLAANNRGESRSKPVILRVRYAPVCQDSEVTVIGASLDEVIRVRCRVSADPSDVTFDWQFSNSGESFDVSPARFATTSSNVSELMYTPASQKDYGTLTCLGRNSIGKQAKPCVFQVIPASKPSPLSNCTLQGAANDSSRLLDIECRPGYDGGLPQTFVLEAYDSRTMTLRFNLSSNDPDSPFFRVQLDEVLDVKQGMPPSLRIFVYAQNLKGRSDKVVLEDITLNDPEKRTDDYGGLNILPLAALLTGSLLTLCLAVLLVVVLAIRKSRHKHCPMAHCTHGADLSAKQPKVLTPQASRSNSMLEINTGDQRYVVAYTLKPTTNSINQDQPITNSIVIGPEHQPDILNAPRGTDVTPVGEPGRLFPRPDSLFASPNDAPFAKFNHKDMSIVNPELYGNHGTATLGRSWPRPKENSFSTIRRDHILTDSIPGPESCV
ncbi:hemicentin-1 isoform X2 [Agrilus planipennis]|nr:hemicentin-1 isoform X2 [Agrilus planipennis]